MDDIAAFSERAQAPLCIGGQNPACGAGRLSQSQPFERPHSTNPDLPQMVVPSIALGAKIDYPFCPFGFPGERPIEPCPAFGRNLRLKAAPDLKLGSRTKLERDEITRASAQAFADVVAADHEVGTVISATAHEDVDMGVLGVPMVDRDPFEPRTEIARGLIHELAGKATQASELARLIRRDDEPEMMPIVFAALSKGSPVCVISGSIEQFARRSVAGDAIAPQIADMGSQATGRTHPAHDTRLDHGAAAAPLQEPRCGEARGAPTPEPATTTAAAT
jgi:hypothetical protein